MKYQAIALVPVSGTSSTVNHNIRVGGYATDQSALKALTEWCRKNNCRFGYVQAYGSSKPTHVLGVK